MSYRSVFAPSTYEKVIERSRFIADCAHAESEEEARAFLAQVRARHPLATHVCYAFVADKAGNLLRFSDDGEPQGTAGMPILEVLRSKKLRETVLSVTRYFGGIKLGAGGLVRAYAGTAAEALAQADVREYRLCRTLYASVGYELFDALKKFLALHGAAVQGTEYAGDVTVALSVEEQEAAGLAAAMQDFLAGRVRIREGDTRWAAFPAGAGSDSENR